jgi:hypothetical protein
LRAGPLSDPKVIEILNSSFVPVYAANQDYDGPGKAPPAEKAERGRIYGTFLRGGLGANDVHIYVVTGAGEPVESLGVANATQEGVLYAFLQSVAAKLSVHPGGPAISPRPLSAPPRVVAQDEMVIHTVARGANKGSWREFPGENWTVLSPAEWVLLLPASPAKVGDSWEAKPEIARKLLSTYYPQMEEVSDVDRNRIEEASLRMKAIAATNEGLEARIEGTLRMLRRFAPLKGDFGTVSAEVIGFMEISTGKPQIRRLSLTSWKASFGTEEFYVAQRYLPPEGLALLQR